MRSKGRLGILLYKSKHAAPGVVTGVLPLLEGAIEETVRCALVDVHLVRDVGRFKLPVALVGSFLSGGSVGACYKQEERSLHLGYIRLRPRRAAVEPDASIELGIQGGLVPRARAAKAEPDSEDRLHRATV